MSHIHKFDISLLCHSAIYCSIAATCIHNKIAYFMALFEIRREQTSLIAGNNKHLIKHPGLVTSPAFHVMGRWLVPAVGSGDAPVYGGRLARGGFKLVQSALVVHHWRPPSSRVPQPPLGHQWHGSSNSMAHGRLVMVANRGRGSERGPPGTERRGGGSGDGRRGGYYTGDGLG